MSHFNGARIQAFCHMNLKIIRVSSSAPNPFLLAVPANLVATAATQKILNPLFFLTSSYKNKSTEVQEFLVWQIIVFFSFNLQSLFGTFPSLWFIQT